ncbi:MAG: sigma 54-interacting transcriptional regulator, partial [Alicyclobacillus sp.]|nr:sigma 54-interacting transcriptional regulator [Alicyclobacillus sp.]
MRVKIALIAPYPELAQAAQELCRTYGERIDIFAVGALEEGVQAGRQAIRQGARVLISRGGTWLRLSQEVSVPVVEIAVTVHDVMVALQKAAEKGKRLGLVGNRGVIGEVNRWSSLLRLQITTIETGAHWIADRERISQTVREHGIDCLVGDARAVECARELGLPSVLIESGKEAIWTAILEARRLVTSGRAPVHRPSALDALPVGLVLAEDETVQFANRTARELLQLDARTGSRLPPSLAALSEQTAGGWATVVVGGQVCEVERVALPGQRRTLFALRRAGDAVDPPLWLPPRGSSNTWAGHTFADLVGSSPAMQEMLELAQRYAMSDATVLICGETGTGKELLAQAIHNASPRRYGPFVATNCAALPDSLLESELFGYEEGAFTGARRGGRRGLFEQADGGTLFLDEIAEAPLAVQQKLLRVLQERRFVRVGGERPVAVDVRIVAATNQDLWRCVEQGRFRADLYFRLSVLCLQTLPLRQRLEDLPSLLERLVYRVWYRRKGVGTPPKVAREALAVLAGYAWPGNVRELENLAEYLVAVCSEGRISESLVRTW